MRRTASLSIYSEAKDNNLANVDHLFSINKKCKIELGIVNQVNDYTINIAEEDQLANFQTINYKSLYGDIVWFPLGIYVMFNPSIGHDTNGVTISMNLKDKMCLLNGDVGGKIHSSVEFSYQDELVDANSTSLEKNPVLIYNIIKELVNHWGNEQLSKIIISEVPLQIKQVVKWIGNSSAFVVEDLNEPMICTSQENAQEWKNSQNLSNAYIKQIEPGYDAGFIYTDFVYPGELVCNAGQTVTSVLDKIIGVIGNYEYFYDVEGNFIFQEKQNYLNMSNTAYWAKEQDSKVANLPTDVYEADTYRLSKPVYNFIHNEFTTAYNNTLNYNNIKNDFVVWGAYKSVNSDTKFPCRFHLAIDKKPTLNKHSIAIYKDAFDIERAIAYYQYEDGTPNVVVNETQVFPQAIDVKDRGLIIKIIQDRKSLDWREELYYQMLEDEKKGTGTNTEQNNSYFQYYAELKEQFPKIYNIDTQEYRVNIKEHPDEITYFLDFIDENSELGQYSVNNIGRRAEIIDSENEGINCVFEPVIPDIVYINKEDPNYYTIQQNCINYGQYWTQIPSTITELFDMGGTLNSCFEKIKDLLYQYTHVNNTISITSLPIYYLEPNTRITVEDELAGIYGDYIIQSISLPLDISSTMTINAYKALQKI